MGNSRWVFRLRDKPDCIPILQLHMSSRLARSYFTKANICKQFGVRSYAPMQGVPPKKRRGKGGGDALFSSHITLFHLAIFQATFNPPSPSHTLCTWQNGEEIKDKDRKALRVLGLFKFISRAKTFFLRESECYDGYLIVIKANFQSFGKQKVLTLSESFLLEISKAAGERKHYVSLQP